MCCENVRDLRSLVSDHIPSLYDMQRQELRKQEAGELQAKVQEQAERRRAEAARKRALKETAASRAAERDSALPAATPGALSTRVLLNACTVNECAAAAAQQPLQAPSSTVARRGCTAAQRGHAVQLRAEGRPPAPGTATATTTQRRAGVRGPRSRAGAGAPEAALAAPVRRCEVTSCRARPPEKSGRGHPRYQDVSSVAVTGRTCEGVASTLAPALSLVPGRAGTVRLCLRCGLAAWC